MKKTLSFLSVLLFIAVVFAQQTVASDFYLMKNKKDAENVLSAINSQLNLPEESYNKLHDLLLASAQSQQEQLAQSPDAERINIIKTRQTAHIENTLQSILGARISEYRNKKAAMEAVLKEKSKD